ncbi:hypothetical protein [Foliimonas ilicis]|uniref:hypothetical protein n=1 Tax=Mesorhizobium sp. SB112 TaxID=3151853 RepID=UPI0032641888
MAGRFQAALRQIEDDLEALTPAGAWHVVILSIACIVAANYFLYHFVLHVQPLCIVPLCLAGWQTDTRNNLAGLAIL